jgi:hypothetical protein
MDPDPRSFAELPVDPELGVPVPFACTSAREVDPRRVPQCALSRVCGICGSGLGRPIAFLGSADEAARNAFHFPPAHLDCAQALLEAYDGVDAAVLGQPEPLDSWALVTTAGFEYVRAGHDQVDRRPTFQPNSRLEERRVVRPLG